MAILKTAIAAGLLGLAFASPAAAQAVSDNDTLATFGQKDLGRLFEYRNAGDRNTIAFNDDVSFNILGGDVQTINGVVSGFSMNAFEQNGVQFEQTGFQGSFAFTSATQNFLSGTFNNATFSFDGDGGVGSLIQKGPTSDITFTSDVFDVAMFTSRGIAFNITGASPTFMIQAGELGQSFDAALSGQFAGSGAGAVPEPASWAMLIVGFGLVGATARRRKASMTAVTA